MRYLLSLVFALFLVITPLSFVSADSGGYMMGSTNWNTNMRQFENNLIANDEVYEQMQDYMETLFDGELTEEQESQMLEWMRSDEYQPVMMSMMMRSMIGNSGDRGWTTSGMMNSWGYGSVLGFGWVTMILVWGFLILGILAFLKILSSKQN